MTKIKVNVGTVYQNVHSGKVFLITAIHNGRIQGIRPDGIAFWCYEFDFEKDNYLVLESFADWFTALKKSKSFRAIRKISNENSKK